MGRLHHQQKQSKRLSAQQDSNKQLTKKDADHLSASRPKRRATNAHIFRYLQTRNPSKLEENDLKRALEASLEDCPDFFSSEDSVSCSSSSEQGNATNQLSSLSGRNSSNSNSSSSHNSCRGNHHCRCPSHIASINRYNNRYKPVAKKNTYNEADFFHDGIMEYIEFQLSKKMSRSP